MPDASGAPTLPPTLPLSVEKLTSEGAFLLDDAVSLFLWLGRGLTQEWMQAVLQARSIEGLTLTLMTRCVILALALAL